MINNNEENSIKSHEFYLTRNKDNHINTEFRSKNNENLSIVKNNCKEATTLKENNSKIVSDSNLKKELLLTPKSNTLSTSNTLNKIKNKRKRSPLTEEQDKHIKTLSSEKNLDSSSEEEENSSFTNFNTD